MKPLVYTTAASDKDLQGIIELQRDNLPVNLTHDIILKEGFVTVVHNLHDLQEMNAVEQHVICKGNEKIIAYLLAMTAAAQHDIPVLIPMFNLFRTILYHGKPVADHNYIVVGQVCVDKNYRGQGILDKCYDTYRNRFENKYDFAITEIATRNTRSIKAHQRIGFTEIYRYTSPDSEEWSIVVWQW
jgi:ribosomal protein S18 acetylase RimI-like enzyme